MYKTYPVRFYLAPFMLSLIQIVSLFRATRVTDHLFLPPSPRSLLPVCISRSPLSLFLLSLSACTTFLPSIGTFRLALSSSPLVTPPLLLAHKARSTMQCLSASSARGVATSRERVCVPQAHVVCRTVGKFSCRRLRRFAAAEHRRCSTGGDRRGNKLANERAMRLPAFTLQESFTDFAKNVSLERREKILGDERSQL